MTTEALDELQALPDFQSLSLSQQEEILRIGGDIIAEQDPQQAESIYTDTIDRVANLALGPIYEKQQKRSELPLVPQVDQASPLRPVLAPEATPEELDGFDFSGEDRQLNLPRDVPQPSGDNVFDPDLEQEFKGEQNRIAGSLQQKPFRAIKTPSGKVVLGRPRFALSKFSEQGYEVLLKDGSRQFVNDAFNDEALGKVAEERYGEQLDSNALALATRRADNAQELGDLFFDGSFSSLSRTEKMAVLDQAAHSAADKALNAKTEEDKAKYQRLSNYAGQLAGSMEKSGDPGLLNAAIENFGEMSDQEMNPVDPWGIRKPLNIAKPAMGGLEATYKTRVKSRLEAAQKAWSDDSYLIPFGEQKKPSIGRGGRPIPQQNQRLGIDFILDRATRDVLDSPEMAAAAEAYQNGDKEAYSKAGLFVDSGNPVLQTPSKLNALYSQYQQRGQEYAAASNDFKAAYLTTPDFSTNAQKTMAQEGFFSAFKEDPVGLINSLFWQSQLTNPELGVVAGLTGAGIAKLPVSFGAQVIGMGAVNAAVEYQNDQATRFYDTLQTEAQAQGYDISTPEGFSSAVNNPSVITRAGMEARNGGMAVALVGGAASALGGKIVSPMTRFWVQRGATNPRIASLLTNVGELGFEMATEYAGEGAGQWAAGQEFNVDEMQAEMFAGSYSGFFGALNAAGHPEHGIQAAINQVQTEKAATQVAKAYMDQAQAQVSTGGAPEILPVNIERNGAAVNGQQNFRILRGEEPVFEGTVHESAIDFLQTGADRLHNWMSGTYIINNEADKITYFQNGERKELTRAGNTDFDIQATDLRKLNDQNQMEDDAANWQDVEAYQLLNTAFADQVRLSSNAKAESPERLAIEQVQPVMDYLFQQDKAIAVNLTNRFGLPIYTQDVAKFRYLTEVPPVRGLTGRPLAKVQLSDGSTRYTVGKRTEATDRDRPFYSGYIDQESYDRISRFQGFDATNKRIQIRGNSIQFLYDEIQTTEEAKRVETEINGYIRTTNTTVESETQRTPATELGNNLEVESEAVTTRPAENTRVVETNIVRAKRTTGRFENFGPASVSDKPAVGKYLFQLPEQGNEYTLNDIDLSAGQVTDVRPYTQAESRIRYSSQPGTKTLGSYAPNNRIVSLMRNANVSTLFEELDHDFLQNVAPLILTTQQLVNLEKALSQYAQSPKMREQLAAGRTRINGKLVPILAKGSKKSPVNFSLKTDGIYSAASQEIFGYMMSQYRASTNGIQTLPPALNVILGQIQNYYQKLFANLGGSPVANLSTESRILLDRFFSTPPELRAITFDTRQMRAQADQVVLASKTDLSNLTEALLNGGVYTPEPNAPIPVPEEPLQVINIVQPQGNPQTIPDALNHFGRTGPNSIMRPGEIVFFPDKGLSGTMYRYLGLTTLPDGTQRRSFEGYSEKAEPAADINGDRLYGPEEISRDIRAGLNDQTAWVFTDESLRAIRDWKELHQAEIQEANAESEVASSNNAIETPNTEVQSALQIESSAGQVLRPEETGPSQGVELQGMVQEDQSEGITQEDQAPQAQEIIDGLATPQNPRGDLTARTGNLVSLEAGDHIVIPASKELLRWNGPNDFQTWTGQGWARANYDADTMRSLFDAGLARRYKEGSRGVATRTYNTSTARMPKLFTRGERGERLVIRGGYQYMVAIGSDVNQLTLEMNNPAVRLVGQIQVENRERPAFIATPLDPETAPVEFLSYQEEDKKTKPQPMHALWKRRQKSNQPIGPTEANFIEQFGSYDAVSDAVVRGMATKAYNNAQGGVLGAARQFLTYTKMSPWEMDKAFDPTGSYPDIGLASVVAYSVLLRNDLQALITQIENGIIPQPENLPEIRALYNAIFLTGDRLGTNMGRAMRQFPSDISPESMVANVEASLVIGSSFYRKILGGLDEFRKEFGRNKRAQGLEDAMKDFGFPINPPVVAVVRQFLSYNIPATEFSAEIREALIEAQLVPTLTEEERGQLSDVVAKYLQIQDLPENNALRGLMLQGILNLQEELKGIDITKLLFETIHKNRVLFKPSTLIINAVGPISQMPGTILSQWAYLWNEGRKRGWTHSVIESTLAIGYGSLRAFGPDAQRKGRNAQSMTAGGFHAYGSEEIEKNVNYSASHAAFMVGMTAEEFKAMPGYTKYLKALGRFMAFALTQPGGRMSSMEDSYFMSTAWEQAFWSKLYNQAASAWYEAGSPGKRGDFINRYIANATTFEVNGVRTPFDIKHYERLAEDEMAIYGDDIIRNSVSLLKNDRTRKRVRTYLAYAKRQSMIQKNMGEWLDSVSDFGRDTAMAQQLPPVLQSVDTFAHDLLRNISFKVVSDRVGTISTKAGRFRIGEGSPLAIFGLLFVTFPLRAFDKFLRFYPYTSPLYTLRTIADPKASTDKKIRTGIDSITGGLLYAAFGAALAEDQDKDSWLDQLLKVNPLCPIEKIRATGAQSFTMGEKRRQQIINPFSIYFVFKPQNGERQIAQYNYIEYPQLAAIIGPSTTSAEYFRSVKTKGGEVGAKDFAASQVMSVMLGLGIGFEKVSPGESLKGLIDMVSTMDDPEKARYALDNTMGSFFKSYANPLSSFQQEALGIVRGYENTYSPKDAQAKLYANSFFEGLVNPERLAIKRNALGVPSEPRIIARFADIQRIPDAVYWMASNDLYPNKPPGQLAVEDIFQKKADKEWAKNTFEEVNNGTFYLLHLKEAEYDAASLWQDWVLQYSKDEDRTKQLEAVVASKDNQLYQKRGDLGKFKTLKEFQQQDINSIISQARDIAAIRVLGRNYTDDKQVQKWMDTIATRKQLAGYTLKNTD